MAIPCRRQASQVARLAKYGCSSNWLVHARHDPGFLDDSVQVCRQEVRDAGTAEPAITNQSRDGLPRGDVVAVVECRQGPMNQEQVEIFQPRILESVLERATNLVGLVVAVAELA